jgi:hypothetical protein
MPAVSGASSGSCSPLSPPCTSSPHRVYPPQIPKENSPSHPWLSAHSLFPAPVFAAAVCALLSLPLYHTLQITTRKRKKLKLLRLLRFGSQNFVHTVHRVSTRSARNIHQRGSFRTKPRNCLSNYLRITMRSQFCRPVTCVYQGKNCAVCQHARRFAPYRKRRPAKQATQLPSAIVWPRFLFWLWEDAFSGYVWIWGYKEAQSLKNQIFESFLFNSYFGLSQK